MERFLRLSFLVGIENTGSDSPRQQNPTTVRSKMDDTIQSKKGRCHSQWSNFDFRRLRSALFGYVTCSATKFASPRYEFTTSTRKCQILTTEVRTSQRDKENSTLKLTACAKHTLLKTQLSLPARSIFLHKFHYFNVEKITVISNSISPIWKVTFRR